MPDFKFQEQKNIDQSVIVVIAYEDKQEMGTLLFSKDGWEDFKEKVLRTKVKCE